MSCKILAQQDRTIPERIHWKEVQNDDPHGSAGAPSAVAEPAEIQKLHNRVIELERSLEIEVRQTRERTFQEGHKAGREEAEARVQPVMDRLLRSCADVAAMRSRIRRETEADIVTLTVAIARRVLRRELSVEPGAIQELVKAALEKVQTKEVCLIRTHPEHVAGVREFFGKSGIGTGLEVAADPSLQLGGLVLETKRGDLDASVETQLKEIERGFTERLGK